jgi:hypothetical protein
MGHWWHHFLYDPMRDNPWSLGAAILGACIPLAWMGRLWWKTRPKR